MKETLHITIVVDGTSEERGAELRQINRGLSENKDFAQIHEILLQNDWRFSMSVLGDDRVTFYYQKGKLKVSEVSGAA